MTSGVSPGVQPVRMTFHSENIYVPFLRCESHCVCSGDQNAQRFFHTADSYNPSSRIETLYMSSGDFNLKKFRGSKKNSSSQDGNFNVPQTLEWL